MLAPTLNPRSTMMASVVPLLVLAAVAQGGATAAGGAPTVQTTNGTVAGVVKYGVASFLGIPFAAAPVGLLRFKTTMPHAGWPGECMHEFGARCCVAGGISGAFQSYVVPSSRVWRHPVLCGAI